MRPGPSEQGYFLVDVVVGLALFGLLMVAIYHLYLPTITLSQRIHAQLATQQDVRLALDRVARALHETTAGRVRVYTAESGCAEPYEACMAFVTARDGQCTGTFQLVNGAPNWQAMVYLWRDVASNELRLRCDPTTTFPPTAWPPTLGPYTVVGTNVAAASFALEPADSPMPRAVAMTVQERPPIGSGAAGSGQTTTYNRTVFGAQNP
jgi:hypothetical protein